MSTVRQSALLGAKVGLKNVVERWENTGWRVAEGIIANTDTLQKAGHAVALSQALSQDKNRPKQENAR